MRNKFLSLAIALWLIFSLTGSAMAQSSLSFSMDQETVNVYWNSDGTTALDFVFTFTNDPGGSVIDFVDVGMPNGNYDWGSISADVGGNPVSISSDYQGSDSYGFAVDMGAYAIPPGQSGSLHVYVGRITDVLYKDTDNPDTYASGVFSPTWFDSDFVHGASSITVIFHLPPGVQPEEPRYHATEGGWPCGDEPAYAYDNEGRITYTWQCSANGYTQYTFGASFPIQYIPAETIVVAPSFNFGNFISGIFNNIQPICCAGFFFLIFVGGPILGAINGQKRKLQYLPPKISIEGHGIKRGLTAVEAGLLMEQPLDKVMTMILFGVVKKNAATVEKRDPLTLKLTEPQPADLHDYEKDFLAAFAINDQAARRKALQEMTVKLVNSISEKMKGFSRKETADYYKGIMERAWQQIEAADTPEVKGQMYDESLEWTMLDKNYDERTKRVFTGPVFIPMWWGNYDPTFRRSITPTPGTSTVSMPGTSGGRVSVPGSTMAASVITSVQGFSSRVLGDMGSFTSGVTNRTNPLPKPSTASKGGGWSGGGGGGRSCACACACAGCACACAGGGR